MPMQIYAEQRRIADKVALAVNEDGDGQVRKANKLAGCRLAEMRAVLRQACG